MNFMDGLMDDEGLAEAKVICRTCWAVIPWAWKDDHFEWHRSIEERLEERR